MKHINVRVGNVTLSLNPDIQQIGISDNGNNWSQTVFTFTDDFKTALIAFTSVLIESEEE